MHPYRTAHGQAVAELYNQFAKIIQVMVIALAWIHTQSKVYANGQQQYAHSLCVKTLMPHTQLINSVKTKTSYAPLLVMVA